MMKKTKRDKLFRLRLECDVVEFEAAMFDGVIKEKKEEIMRIYWADAKRQERRERCLLTDGTRCANGDCGGCPHYKAEKSPVGAPLSTEKLAEDGILSENGLSVEAYIEQKELHQALYAAIDTLGKIDRQIILLIYIAGHSEREIEDLVGLKQSSINLRKRNALKKLREILKDFA